MLVHFMKNKVNKSEQDKTVDSDWADSVDLFCINHLQHQQPKTNRGFTYILWEQLTH